MNYNKPSLTLSQQVDLLLSRGVVGDHDLMEQRLATVSYYRLSAYWIPLLNTNDTFRPGTTFDRVWRRYTFDRSLKLLALDAIERIEVAAGTLLAYHHSQEHGPFAYAEDAASLPHLNEEDEHEFHRCIKHEMHQGRREQFVEHFRSNYSNEYLPVWMASELMSFGTMLTFYRGASQSVREKVAKPFAVPEKVFNSWLQTLNTIRNICAHHGRLWNRELGRKPLIPFEKTFPAWHDPTTVPNNRVFGIITICRHCLRQIAPQSAWPNHLFDLFDEYNDVPLTPMAMPKDWRRMRYGEIQSNR